MSVTSSSLERHKQILDALPIGFVLTNTDYMITYSNPEFSRMCGLPRHKVVGTKIWKFLIATNDSEQSPEIRLNSEKPISDEFLLLKKSDKCIFVQVTALPYLNTEMERAGTIFLVKDLTDEKKAEILQDQNKRLLDLYARLLQHDLLNDLQVISGYLETVLETIREPSLKLLDMLRAAQSAVHRMAGVIRVFNQADNFVETDLPEMLKRVVDESQKAHLGLDIQLQIESNGAPMRIFASPLLPTAFHNIFRNAAQHVKGDVLVTVNLKQEANTATITISDNGPGIPEELRDKIFKYRLGNGSSGLGLYLTHQIVESCGGTITYLDSKKKGCSFCITLPLLAQHTLVPKLS